MLTYIRMSRVHISNLKKSKAASEAALKKADDNGYLSVDEYVHILKENDIQYSKKDIEFMMHLANKNQDQ